MSIHSSLWFLCDIDVLWMNNCWTTLLISVQHNSIYLQYPNPTVSPSPSVWLAFCTWCFPGCACSVVLAEELLSLVASVRSTTPTRRRRRIWMTGKAFIVFEFQSKGVWLICCTSVISCTTSWALSCLLPVRQHIPWCWWNWIHQKPNLQGHTSACSACGLHLQFVVILEPCYILAWVPISWQTSLWSCTNHDWLN